MDGNFHRITQNTPRTYVRKTKLGVVLFEPSHTAIQTLLQQVTIGIACRLSVTWVKLARKAKGPLTCFHSPFISQQCPSPVNMHFIPFITSTQVPFILHTSTLLNFLAHEKYIKHYTCYIWRIVWAFYRPKSISAIDLVYLMVKHDPFSLSFFPC